MVKLSRALHLLHSMPDDFFADGRKDDFPNPRSFDKKELKKTLNKIKETRKNKKIVRAE